MFLRPRTVSVCPFDSWVRGIFINRRRFQGVTWFSDLFIDIKIYSEFYLTIANYTQHCQNLLLRNYLHNIEMKRQKNMNKTTAGIFDSKKFSKKWFYACIISTIFLFELSALFHVAFMTFFIPHFHWYDKFACESISVGKNRNDKKWVYPPKTVN